MTMRSVLLCLLVCLPLEARAEELDELEALQITVRKAIERIEPCIVRITTVGGIRRVDVPTEFKPDDSAPERPREDDDDAREEDEEDEDDGDNEGRGRTPELLVAVLTSGPLQAVGQGPDPLRLLRIPRRLDLGEGCFVDQAGRQVTPEHVELPSLAGGEDDRQLLLVNELRGEEIRAHEKHGNLRARQGSLDLVLG